MPHAISHVGYKLADGTVVKVDGYGGEIKNPIDPQQYSDNVGTATNPVTGYVIKAGPNFYDENGNQLSADEVTALGYPNNGMAINGADQTIEWSTLQ